MPVKNVQTACIAALVAFALSQSHAARAADGFDGFDPVTVDALTTRIPAMLDARHRLSSGPPLALAVREKDRGEDFVVAQEGCFRTELVPARGDEPMHGPLLTLATQTRVFRHVRIEHEALRPDTPLVAHSLVMRDGWVEDAANGGTHVVTTTKVPLKPLAVGPQGVVAYGYADGRYVHILTEKGVRYTGAPRTCAMLQIVLDRHKDFGDAKRIEFTSDDGKRTWLSASVSKTQADPQPIVAVSFSGGA